MKPPAPDTILTDQQKQVLGELMEAGAQGIGKPTTTVRDLPRVIRALRYLGLGIRTRRDGKETRYVFGETANNYSAARDLLDGAAYAWVYAHHYTPNTALRADSRRALALLLDACPHRVPVRQLVLAASTSNWDRGFRQARTGLGLDLVAERDGQENYWRLVDTEENRKLAREILDEVPMRELVVRRYATFAVYGPKSGRDDAEYTETENDALPVGRTVCAGEEG
jgi:hypothetical protein